MRNVLGYTCLRKTPKSACESMIVAKETGGRSGVVVWGVNCLWYKILFKLPVSMWQQHGIEHVKWWLFLCIDLVVGVVHGTSGLQSATSLQQVNC